MSKTERTTRQGLRAVDWLFLMLIAAVLVLVAWVGTLAYEEGLKTEVTKTNGETWQAWLTKASAEREKSDFQPEECAAGNIEIPDVDLHNAAASTNLESDAPDAVLPVKLAARTWGSCYRRLTDKGGPLSELINPFFNESLKLATQCDRTDQKLAGALVLEKINATPSGSAVATVITPLVDTDPINAKMQIRISLCDKGAYAIVIGEVEF